MASPSTLSTSFAALERFSPIPAISSYFRELAPSASFADQSLALAPESSLLSKSLNIEEAAKSAYARLADGTYVDDTSVAFAVSHIQDSEGFDDNSEITLFRAS